MWEGCIIFDFRGLQHKTSFRSRFGGVWGRVLGAFWAILAGFWGFERRPILKPKLEAQKMVPRPRGGVRELGLAALILVNDHPSLASLIVGSLESLIIGS